MVAKKTSRSVKSAVPESATPVESASVEGANRRKAAVKSAASRSNGAAPRATRAKRSAVPAAKAALSPVLNGDAPSAAEVAPVMVPGTISDEDIRVRAYFLSIEYRGQGSPEFFWHLAERQLRGNSR